MKKYNSYKEKIIFLVDACKFNGVEIDTEVDVKKLQQEEQESNSV